MIGLTTKLNERDESLVQLQYKLEVYEKIFKELKDLLMNPNDTLQIFENLFKANNLSIPSILTCNNEKDHKLNSRDSKLLNNISSNRNSNFLGSKAFGKAKLGFSTHDKIYVLYHVENNEEGNYTH